MKLIFFAVVIFVSYSLFAQTLTQKVEDDALQLLTSVLGSGSPVSLKLSNNTSNVATLECRKNQLVFKVNASPEEASATLYYLIRKLGFVFPHPRTEIKPTKAQILSKCNKTFTWKPRLQKRGFHLHLMHPSEWVAGYYLGPLKIAQDTNRWLARNQQNVLDLQMLQIHPEERINLINALQNAHNWGLETGLSVSFAMIQQRSYNIIPYLSVLFHWNEEEKLAEHLNKFLNDFPIDFVTFELGSSEFTATKPERTIAWMNKAAQVLKERKKGMFIKVHASNNQYDEKHGNFNFLPQFADPYVGILPHTVYFYGLVDSNAPMYHRKDYKDMQDFYLKESQVRPSMYYPETSYFIFMDIDAGLFLTDYLKIRTDDVDWMQDHGLTGHLNFSTGQEVGYWLMDYQVALLADPDSRKNPFLALKLIGEDVGVWQKILDWQNLHFKQRQLIQALFFSNLIDETPFAKPVHEHIIVRDFKKNRMQIKAEIEGLEEAIKNQPPFADVKNKELRNMLQVTALRMRHSMNLRKAALLPDEDKVEFDRLMNEAQKVRIQAFEIVADTLKKYNRYPEVPLSSEWENPTSYKFGYLMTTRDFSQWEREELILRESRISPLFKSLVNPLRIILPRKIFEFFNWF